MCDCRERLYKDAQRYIKLKMDQISVKQYLYAYGDLNELESEVQSMQQNLENSKRNVISQFSLNDYVNNKVAEQLLQNYNKYVNIQEPRMELLKELQSKVELNKNLRQEIDQKIKEVNNLIEQKSQITQQDFEFGLLAKLNQQENEFEQIKIRIQQVLFELEERKLSHQFLESKIQQIFQHQAKILNQIPNKSSKQKLINSPRDQ